MKITNNLKKLIFAMSILAAVTLACGQFSVGVENSTNEQITVDDQILATPTIEEEEPTQEPTSPSLDWIQTANQAGYSLPAELAGLVYRQGESIWLASDDSNPVLVAADTYSAQLSPDFTKLVYVEGIYEEEDLVLVDLNTGDSQILTNTPLMMEGAMQWWAANPDVIVFNQVPNDQLGPWAGYLGALDLAATERLDLDMQSSSYSGFALSPDGRTILYDDAGQPVMYLWDEGISRLNMAGYGLNYETYRAPAWSPDGKTVAFYATRTANDSGPTEAAIVIVDLESGQARELHPHRTIGQRGGPEIAFSSDGLWLAVVNPGEEAVAAGGPMAMWVLSVDGSEEQYLGFGSGPIWSPTGDKLLFTLWPSPGTGGGSFQQDAHITLVEVGEWALNEIVPLVGSELLSWYPLP